MTKSSSAEQALAVARSGDLAAVASAIMQMRDEATVESLFVTSCNAGEGKTSVALRFALAAASYVEMRVLLVDCNPTRPVLADIFDASGQPGFSDLLRERVDASDIIRTSSIDRLHIAPFGSAGSEHLSIYAAENLRTKLRALSDSIFGGYDIVIVDGPSGADRPDLSVSAAAFDGVVMVIECERTRWEVAQNYEARLTAASANMVGAVMNKRRYYIPKGLYR